MTTQRRTREQRPRPNWPVPVALSALSAIPLIVGALRLLQLAGGPELIAAEERFAGFPLPVALHIFGAATYVLLGTLQFVPRFRRRHRTWHRRAGRILIVAGLLVAVSALWMTLLYAAKPATGDLLYVLRLVFGCALVACLILGFTAIRRRDIPAHRAWMIRAYAIALAAGTQAFTQAIGGALLGVGEPYGDVAQGAGWVINLAVAEWIIRRPARPGRRSRHLPLHGLRHRFVAILVAAGRSVREVSESAGHNRVASTLTRHGGLFGGGSENAVNRLDHLLSGGQPPGLADERVPDVFPGGSSSATHIQR